MPKEIEEQIINFIKEYYTYGPERTGVELKSVGHTSIYNILKKRGLNTALDEFFSADFRKKRYKSIQDLQIDLENCMDYYN